MTTAAEGPLFTSRMPRRPGSTRLRRWPGSIRMRLTLTYALAVLGLSAVVLGGVYVGMARDLSRMTISQEASVDPFYGRAGVDHSDHGGHDHPPGHAPDPGPGGVPAGEETRLRSELATLETAANDRALRALRDASLGSLAALVVVSLLVGRFAAGRMLRPIGRISAVARRISATDLSQRISLEGSPDELRSLADTFDDMLDRLDRSFKAQRGFVEDASHELRNPLAVIRSNLDTILADPSATLEDYRAGAHQVGRSVERMTRVVEDLVTFARHEVRPEQLALLDVAEVVEAAAAEFAGYAANRGVRLTRAAPDGLLILGDAGSLRQALANLLSNALRVAPAGSEVRVGAGGEGTWIWIGVEDRGPGIPEADRERVFQRFQRGEPAPGEGRGLGLAIVRQIVESHRGEVRLASREGAGSVFTIWLPATGHGSPGARLRRRRPPRSARQDPPSSTPPGSDPSGPPGPAPSGPPGLDSAPPAPSAPPGGAPSGPPGPAPSGPPPA